MIDDDALVLHLSAPKHVSVEDIVRWLGGSRHRNLMDVVDDRMVVYRNPDTGVEATFEFEDPADLAGRLPADMQPAGVRFRLPWPSPSFCAREAIPVLVELADSKGLMVALPRPNSGEMIVMAATAPEIIRLWEAGNAEAVHQERPTQLPYMNPGRSDRWWLYQSRKQELHRRFGEDVFVPTLVGVASAGRADNLQLHITWTDAIPLVIPECDLVTLLDGKRPSDFKIRGTVPYSEVRIALEPFLESIEVEGFGALPLLMPKQARKARSVFLNLSVRELNHVEAAPAGWVDVR